MNAERKRLALITGAASGIGYGIARAAGREGFRIVLADIDESASERAAASLGAEGIEARPLRLDVGSDAAWQQASELVESQAAGLDLLVNNAGITGTGRPVAELEAAEWRRIIEVNLTGLFLGTRTMLPLLRKPAGGAHIVNTASMGALLPYAGGASYTASKAGMLAFSECLRQELQGSCIGVSVLLPAQVRTRLFDTSAGALDPDTGDAMSRRAAQVASLQRDGLDPLVVGERVMRAVREREFYVFTHPELEPIVTQRFSAMLTAMRDPPRSVVSPQAPTSS